MTMNKKWRILTNKETLIKITLVWTCTKNVRKYKFHKSIVYGFGNNKPRCRSRNRWQDEARENGRIIGREEWRKKVYGKEEWKKERRTARNCRILHIRMEPEDILSVKRFQCEFYGTISRPQFAQQNTLNTNHY
jgi:hypothetical protein